MALITCRDLCLGYHGAEIVQGLSFEVKRGDYLCVLGENGSGKSTLMRTVLGLQQPLSGQVLFGDGLSSRKIGYLPQQTQIQRDFPASVREVVSSGFEGGRGWRPLLSRAEKQRAEALIESLGLSGLAGRAYRSLSGGQQQRVLLARALCATDSLLLLDEPTAGLDPLVTAELYQRIFALNRDEGLTVMMVSHDVAAAMRYASHILHIGRSLFFGTKEAYLQSPIGAAFTEGSVRE